MTNRMFSPEALAQFRKFLAVDSRTHAKPGSPEGAFDQITPALRKKLARDSSIGPQKTVATPTFDQDDDDDNPIESGRRGDIDQLIQLVSNLAEGDEEAMNKFCVALEKAFPGSMGEMSDNVTEDTADLDDPPANEFGEPYTVQRGAVYGDMPPKFKGMPKPGGTLYGEDSYSRFFPEASHIVEDNQVKMQPSRESLMAMDSADDSYEAMFPGVNARIKNLY